MRQRRRVAVSCAALVGALIFLQLRSSGDAVPVRRPLDTLPVALGAWQGREGTILDADARNVLRVKDHVIRRYVDTGGHPLWVYIGYWDTQRKGAQMHSPKNCLPGSGWEPLEASRLSVPLPAPHPPLVVNRYLIQKDGEQQIVLYWYRSQGKAIPGEMAARAEMVRSALFHNRTDGALIRVSAPVVSSAATTTDRLITFVQALSPVLPEYLPD